jgi:hypothetical protein
MNNELEHFKNKYRAHIQEGRKRYTIPKRFKEWNDMNFNESFETEHGVQIDMSQRDFETLIGMEKYWEEQLAWRDSHQYAGHAKSIVDRHEREVRIRNNNPAAKKAYEKYLNILYMVDSYYD